MESASGKVCQACGQDCSGRPRVKDPAGRYYCRECHEQLAQRKRQSLGARAALRSDDDGDAPGGLLEELLAANESSTPEAIRCAQCGGAMAAEAVLCTTCGYSRVSGAAITTEVRRPRRVPSGGGGAVWPIVIGAISIVIAAIGLISNVLDATGETSRGLLGTVIGIVLSCWVGYAGLGVMLRRPSAVGSLRAWAIVVLVLCALAITCLGVILAIGSDEFMAGFEEGLLEATEEIGIYDVQALYALFFIEVALSALWPIFVLIWFRRAAVRAQIADW